VGWGSRKVELVDRLGDPNSIFEKIRLLVRALPEGFWPKGFNDREHLLVMRCLNPSNGSAIIGETGDDIGRGARTLIYFKDESAHYAHPESIEAALSDTTRVPIDISSVNGPGNIFHRRREAGVEWVPGEPMEPGQTRVFVLDWRDHPEKTDEWHAKRERAAINAGTQHLLAQEVDRNYFAALEGRIIEVEWIRAAFDAHKIEALGIPDEGPEIAALDVADSLEGTSGDRNAIARRRGVVLKAVKEWGERDPGLTARRAVAEVSGLGPVTLEYDPIGVGAGVKTEINRLRDDDLLPAHITVIQWNAAGPVLRPAERVVPDDENSPRNKDFYRNLKAQGWWELRGRFYRTWRAVNEGAKYDPDELISLDTASLGKARLRQIEKELSQATAARGTTMKLVVNKAPEGTRSPNVGDAIVMAYHPVTPRAPAIATGLPVFLT
jgi:hypothetical protein